MAFVKAPALNNWSGNVEHNGNYMFRNMTENNRKRSREDDSCEFMPLSKRINNLHINNNLASSSAQGQETSQHNQGNGENRISTSNSPSELERRPSYDPGVGSSHSNYYYDNKLLFELHLERIQRTGQEFPF